MIIILEITDHIMEINSRCNNSNNNNNNDSDNNNSITNNSNAQDYKQ